MCFAEKDSRRIVFVAAVQTANRLVAAGAVSAGGDRAGGPRGWRRGAGKSA